MTYSCCHAPTTVGASGTAVPFSQFTALHLDDICIFSATEMEHLEHIRAVLLRLRKHKLYCKASKCLWMVQQIEFLGHTFSSEGLSVTPAKSAALLKWPASANVSELRSLPGTFGFLRDFIPRYADITAPLTRLSCKNIAWRWGEEQAAAFARLKAAVAAAPLLRPPDTCKRTTLLMGYPAALI